MAFSRRDRAGVADGEETTSGKNAGRGALAIWLVLALGSGAATLWFDDGISIAIAASILLMVLLVAKVPLAVCLAVSGSIGLFSMGGLRLMGGTFADIPYSGLANWTWTVLPMFIFMGLMLGHSGAVSRVFDFSKQWLRWLPGGLAIGTNGAGALLSAVTGSTIATVNALARVTVPEMLKAGYDKRLATSSVLMAGTGGQLIPPSILLVIFAGIANAPVGPQLIAGIIPGIVLVVAFTLLIVAIAVARPGMAPKSPQAPHTAWRDRFTSLGRVWPVPLLVVVVLGGMYAGIFTATEAAAFGALGALILGIAFLGVRKGGREAGSAFMETAVATASIFFLVIGALIFNRLLSISGVATALSDWVISLEPSRVGFLLLLIPFYVLLGTVMDALAMMLLTVPLFLPLLVELDISVLFFGVFVVFLGELAQVSPPVGIVASVVHKVVQDKSVNLGTKISLNDVFISSFWFIPVCILFLLVLIFAPELVDWLPAQMAEN